MFAKQLPALVAAVFVPVLPAYFGATSWLGAHPWWSTNIAWIDGPLGLALAVFAVTTGLRRTPAIAGSAILLILAGLSAHFGKAEFAASFAEKCGRALLVFRMDWRDVCTDPPPSPHALAWQTPRCQVTGFNIGVLPSAIRRRA